MQNSDAFISSAQKKLQSGIDRTQSRLELRQARARLRSIRKARSTGNAADRSFGACIVDFSARSCGNDPSLSNVSSEPHQRTARWRRVYGGGMPSGNYRKSTSYHVSFVPGSGEDVYSATRASYGWICRGHRLCFSCGRSCRNSDCLADSSSQPAILRSLQGLQNRQPHDLIFSGNR